MGRQALYLNIHLILLILFKVVKVHRACPSAWRAPSRLWAWQGRLGLANMRSFVFEVGACKFWIQKG